MAVSETRLGIDGILSVEVSGAPSEQRDLTTVIGADRSTGLLNTYSLGILNDSGFDKNPLIRVPSGAGDVEINEAHQWIKDRFEFGTIELDPFGTYTIGDTVNLEFGLCSIKGNRAKWNAPSLGSGKFALSLENTLNGNGPLELYPFMSEISDLYIYGNGTSTRDYNAGGIRANSSVTSSSIRGALRNVNIANFGTGVSLGSRTYFFRGYNFDIRGCAVGLLQEANSEDYSENNSFFGGAIYNSDVLVKALSGQKFKFYGTSFDYFGDGTGSRITGTENAFDLRAGCSVELYGCHVEWSYGKFSGQNRSPVSLTGANTRFSMIGGFFGVLDNTRQPYYKAPISSDNASQAIVFKDVMVQNLARSGQDTSDNELICGSASNNTGFMGSVTVSNLIPHNWSLNDLPAVISNTIKGNVLRNGIDAPYSELFFRTNVTGSAVIANQASPDGSVTARNSTGSMLKITGAGKVLISLPNYGQDVRHMWGFYLNTSQAVGTVTVKQRDCSVVQSWDGANALVTKADTRNSYSSATKSIVCGGTNQFNIISWKDVHADPQWSMRMSGGSHVVIEIDTSAMTSGSIYLDDVAFYPCR